MKGCPEMIDRLGSTFDAAPFVDHGIRLQHFVVSSCVREMIMGSHSKRHAGRSWAPISKSTRQNFGNGTTTT
jgi:hypothetical protein